MVVLTAAATWKHRFVVVLTDLPYTLLHIIEAAPCCQGPRRQEIAQPILCIPRCCLKKQLHSDVSGKLVLLFYGEFQDMAVAGECDVSLYTVILALRAALGEHTHDIEGFNGALQAMANMSRRMNQATADAMLSIRYGGEISAEQCAAIDKQIGEVMTSTHHEQRYVRVAGTNGDDIPAFFKGADCDHSSSEESIHHWMYV
ncbi:hypothetical protein N9L19_00595 [bacterium]|nr:hypothetical protein [bacterium]